MAQRFQWPWTVIDAQDEGRTIKAMTLLNAADAYTRVVRAVEQHALSGVSTQDWELYRIMEEAAREEGIDV